MSLTQRSRQIFAELGHHAQVRWLDRELEGYGTVSEIRPLHEVLDVPAGDRLAVGVMAYRIQVGRRWARPSGSDELVHFFVEPLAALVSGRDRVRAARASPLIELSFGPHPGAPQYPASAEFPADVFDRILTGFSAALQRELEGLVS